MALYYWEYIEISQWNVCWREREKRRNEFVFSKTLRFVPLHLTRYLELRESYWELCDSQRLWKSRFLEVFAGFWGVFSKLALVYEETTGCLCNFVGYFSDFFPWNSVFFPWDFENLRRNLEIVGRNSRKMPKVWKERAEKDKTETGKVCFDFLEWRKILRFSPFGINISPSWFRFVWH